ncbi:MAG TPA: O-antigen ligase family protein [Ignavibacteriaceae bacterium]|nr:O-antigen ligase family protein [Ignavibacteriaceae bacterium]
MRIFEAFKNSGTIDKVAFFFLVLFLGSLTNSIFINQLGYYGALVTILIKLVKEKNNPFSKSGLEIALVLFILAEIISTIFSIESASSFNNLLKRVLLIPIIYVVASVPKTLQQIKVFFRVYLSVAIISVLIYHYFSLHFYIENLYHVVQSGPSVFQYPITASEIMTFTGLFCFAFLINEKEELKTRIISFILTILSFVALFATYKRTGWIAAFAGIFFILLFKRKWVLILLILVVAVAVAIKDKEWSNIDFYSTKENDYIKTNSLNTEGKAHSVFAIGEKIIASDYDGGVKLISQNEIVNTIETPSPAISGFTISDSLAVIFLVDTRFVLLKTNTNEFIKEFQTTGYTHDYKYFNNKLYVLDLDSGLTIFPDILNSKETIRIPYVNKYSTMDVDSNRLLIFSAEKGLLIFNLVDGIPIDSGKYYPNTKHFLPFYFYKNHLVTSDGNYAYLLDVIEDSLIVLNKSDKIKRLTHFVDNDSVVYLVNSSKDVFTLSKTSAIIDEAKFLFESEKHINSLLTQNDEIVITSFKQSRIKSIWDIHNPSNASRFALWRGGMEIFIDYPIFGVGDIDLALLYSKYKRTFDKEIQGHMHNNYVHILVILGLFGFIAVMFLLTKMLIINIQIFNGVKSIPFLSSLALGTLGGFIAFLFAGLTEWNFGDHEIITMVWFTFGLNYAAYRIYLNNKKLLSDD